MPRRSHTSKGNQVAGRGPREGASRLRVLQALQAADQGLGVRELATEVGLHTNTVRMQHYGANGQPLGPSERLSDSIGADWNAAEEALFTSVSVVPYANNVLTTFGQKATFTEGDGIDPASIRMYE